MIQKWWDGACLTPLFDTDVITRRKWAIKAVIFLAANMRHFLPLSSSVAEYLFAAVPITHLWPQSCKQNRLKHSLPVLYSLSLSVEEHAVQPWVQRAAAGLPLIFCFSFGIRNQKPRSIFPGLGSFSMIMLSILLNVSLVFYCANGCSCTSL